VENNLRVAFQAIEQRDRDKARKVIVGDFEIDQQEIEVEEECLKLLALYQPVAGDLPLSCSRHQDQQRTGAHR